MRCCAVPGVLQPAACPVAVRQGSGASGWALIRALSCWCSEACCNGTLRHRLTPSQCPQEPHLTATGVQLWLRQRFLHLCACCDHMPSQLASLLCPSPMHIMPKSCRPVTPILSASHTSRSGPLLLLARSRHCLCAAAAVFRCARISCPVTWQTLQTSSSCPTTTS